MHNSGHKWKFLSLIWPIFGFFGLLTFRLGSRLGRRFTRDVIIIVTFPIHRLHRFIVWMTLAPLKLSLFEVLAAECVRGPPEEFECSTETVMEVLFACHKRRATSWETHVVRITARFSGTWCQQVSDLFGQFWEWLSAASVRRWHWTVSNWYHVLAFWTQVSASVENMSSFFLLISLHIKVAVGHLKPSRYNKNE